MGLVDETFAPSCTTDKIQVIYIQPHLRKKDSATNRITFNELASDIEDVYSDSLSLRFAKSLRLWSDD